MLVRLLSLGDIGVSDGMMHIGDEAMFEALRDEMRARGAELIAVSAEPAESADRYGIDAVPRIDTVQTEGAWPHQRRPARISRQNA